MNNISGESFKTFGEMLRYIRVREQMTQRDLAIAVGYSDAHINRLEKGLRQADPDVVSARFINALRLKNQPETAARLMELARGSKPLNGAAAADDTVLENTHEIASSASKHNLPVLMTELVGRAADIEVVIQLLTRNQQPARLITLIGPPGVGKTRLAIQSGWEVRDQFADGVWFVQMSQVDDPQLIAETIAQTLELPSDNVPPLVLLTQHLRNKHLLLVLDNMEQLLGQDEERDAASHIEQLLAAIPGLKVLTTSRVALHLQGEHLFEVQPLAEQPAVELFLQRARALKHDFDLSEHNTETVIEICRRLDGLPLAIELAAARVKIFDPEQLLMRLSSRLTVLTTGARNLPERQRTLRGTIEWSYNLLTHDEQLLFQRFGIFAGGGSLEAVERVAGHGLRESVIDLMQSLVEKGLIKAVLQHAETRFIFLESLREYALERMKLSVEYDDLRSRHASYYADYAERIKPEYDFQETPAWISLLEQEHDNFIEALAEARRLGNAPLQVRLIASINPLLARLRRSTNDTWLLDLFAQPEAHAESLIFAKAIYHVTTFMVQGKGYFSVAQRAQLLQHAYNIFEGHGDKAWQAAILEAQGRSALSLGEYSSAERRFAQSAQLFESINQKSFGTYALMWSGGACRDQGRYLEAEIIFNACLASFDEMSDRAGTGLTLNGMGDLEHARGDYLAADDCYARALDYFPDTMWRKLPLRGRGIVAYTQGRNEEAFAFLHAFALDARQWSNLFGLNLVLHHLAFVRHVLGDTKQAHAELRQVILQQQKLLNRPFLIQSLERCAWIEADTAQPHRAAQLFGATEALRKSLGAPLPAGDKPLHTRYLEMTQNALDRPEFDRLLVEGAAMSLVEAVECSLSDEE